MADVEPEVRLLVLQPSGLGPPARLGEWLLAAGAGLDGVPPGAVCLAASPRCENQAFRVGAAAWGVQGHIETTPELVLSWERDAPELAAYARPGSLDPEHLRAEHEDIEHAWRPVAERFVA